MTLGQFIEAWRYRGFFIKKCEGRNPDFFLDTHQVHFVGHSFGDALRCGAIIKDRAKPGKEQVVFVEQDWPFGFEVMCDLSFVDWVIGIPKELTRLDGRDLDMVSPPFFKDLPIDHAHFTAPYLGVSPDGVALDYELSDFAFVCDTPDRPYVVMQPFTRWNKSMFVPNFRKYAGMFHDAGYGVVLVGGGKDEVPDVPDYVENPIGKTSVAESIWIAANADAAVGVESWCASFLPMMGKPSVMLCVPSSVHLYGERWQKAWPGIRLASEATMDADVDSLMGKLAV